MKTTLTTEREMEKYLEEEGYYIFTDEGTIDSTKVCDIASDLGYDCEVLENGELSFFILIEE
jgi:hypothetical protein